MSYLDLLLLVSYLSFLFPIAAYCLVLALVNRRARPTMVSGVADFIGLLFAVAGAVFVSGPVMIVYSYERNVGHPFGAAPNEVKPFPDILLHWQIVWVLYYVLVLVGGALLLATRRRITVLYNVDAERFQTTLARVCAKLHLTLTRSGRRYALQPMTKDAVAEEHGVVVAPEGRHGVVTIEPFPMMSNLTLHWEPGSEAVRAEVEDELRTRFDEIVAEDNPTFTWLLGLSTMLFGMVFLVTLFVLAGAYLPRRH